MKKTILYVAGIILVSTIACLFVACGGSQPKGRERSVLVFHSWDDSGEDGQYFRDKIRDEFYKVGINANIHHIYANMRHRSNEVFTTRDWPEYLDSIRSWKPEIILLNDDPILSWVLKERPCDSLFFNTPIVFAGINGLIRDSVIRYPLMTGFGCNMNLTRCVEMMHNVTGAHFAYVELDNSPYDVALRNKLYGQLSDTTRFINNSKEHLPCVDEEYLDEHYPSKTVISFISCAAPKWNGYVKDDIEVPGSRVLKEALENSSKACHIQVKYDIFSTALTDFNKMPQFSCIRANFNNPDDIRILGGFFTSTAVQIKDQVDYAARILKGASPSTLNTTVHMSDFYMDYNAMQKFRPALKYNDFADKYHIINAPMALEKPGLYYLIIFLIVSLVFGFIIIMAQLLYHWRQRGQKALLDDLLYEDKMHDLIFSNSDDTLWHINGDNITFTKEFAAKHNMPRNTITSQEFEEMIHPGSLLSLKLLRDFRNQRGKKTLRFQMTFDGKQSWSWHEMTYTATDESANTGYLYGIMLNIDKKKEVENTLAEAQMKASEVALKENFLANISHDLRTPLNAITGFSSLLTNKDMTFEEGEREEYGKIIHQNTDMILNMIDSVMQKAQLESGELELIMKPANINDIVQKVYLTNKIIAPSHLKFSIVPTSKEFMVNIDTTRTMQVINNFLSNAFKFTAEGSVTMGWKEHKQDDTVEVYVKDTGIGIDEEGQKHIFDRYYKEKENDKGTGLGLNISKTIIEKQGGTVGIESKLGVGSKFFFRLPRYVQSLLIVLGFGMSAGLFSACNRQQTPPVTSRVVVIHGYSKTFPNYLTFDEELSTALRKYNVNADIKNIYLGLENPEHSGEAALLTMLYSIEHSGWQPDIIIAEGDRSAQAIASSKNEKLLTYLDSLPIVMGGIHHPNWNLMREHKNIVAFYDPIDYPTNINLVVELTEQNIVNIELDDFFQDSIIKKELAQTIARPPYVNKIGTRPTISHFDDTKIHLSDSIIIFTTSVVENEMDINTDMYMHAWMIPQLSVKFDLYTTGIIEKTNRPQFTSVKAGFADGTARYLAGYFASYETMANDLADAASQMLQGASSKSLSGKQHKKQHYMDYQAMKKLGLNYYDYSSKYHIVNAPIKYKYPLLYYAEYLTLFGFGLLIIFIWLSLINHWRERSEQVLINNIKRKANLRVMSLNGADSKPVRNEEGVKELLSHIHPDHRENSQFILQALRIEGTHMYDIIADINNSGQYEWWQLRFVVLKTKDGQIRIDGLIININESKRYEEEMRTAIHLAEEAKHKEDFLMTISHEIRTPLNAVVGFSDVMISLPPEMLTQEELDEFSRNINENNAKLAAMIDDILMFSRIESGRLHFVNAEFNASELLQELYDDWHDKIPRGVTFTLYNLYDNIYIYSDRARVKYVLNQLVSNAVKFTTEGNILLSAIYHYKDKKIEFRVEDSGCGISQEKQTAVFNLFWKDNEFVPGLGLGLNVAHRLTEGMNAKLQVDSSEGLGSVFSFIIDATLTKTAKQAESTQ